MKTTATPNHPPGASVRPAPLIGWMEGLADETRLRLLHLLEREELSVQELCGVLRSPQSTVSTHLKTLLGQGFLQVRKQGTASLYRVDSGADPQARRLWKLAREASLSWPTVEQDGLRLEVRLEERRQGAEKFFAGAAAEWDELRAQLYGARFEREALLGLLPADWTVADLGCGAGAIAQALAPHVRRVLAIDQSAAMLRAARRRLGPLADPVTGNVELHQAELSQLPLERGSCDAALAVLVLSWVPEVGRVLAEAARVLRPGGRLVLVDLARHADEEFARKLGQVRMGFAQPELTSALEEAGFRSCRLRPIPPEPSARGPSLFLATAQTPALPAQHREYANPSHSAAPQPGPQAALPLKPTRRRTP